MSLRVGSEIKSLTPLQFTFCSGLAVKGASAQLSASVAMPAARLPTTTGSNSPETKAQINSFLSKLPWPWCVPTTTEKQLIDGVRSLALAARGGKVAAEISRAQKRQPGLGWGLAAGVGGGSEN